MATDNRSQVEKAISHMAKTLRLALDDLDHMNVKRNSPSLRAARYKITWVASELEISIGERNRITGEKVSGSGE